MLIESVIAAGSYTSMSKGQATVGDSTSHTPCMAGRGWHDELPDGCGKSVLPLQRVKTIRIAESSDMDSWKELLWPCASFGNVLRFERKMEMLFMCNYTDESVWGCWKRGGPWGAMIEKCKVLCPESGKCFMQLYQGVGRRLLENRFDQEWFWSEKEEFWRNNQMVIFWENVY